MILSYTNKTQADKYSLTTRCPVQESCQWVTNAGIPVVLITTVAWHLFVIVDSTVLEATVQNTRGGAFNRIARCFMCPENGRTNLTSICDAIGELDTRGDYIEIELFHKDLKYPRLDQNGDGEEENEEEEEKGEEVDQKDESSQIEIDDESERVCLRLLGTEARFTRNDLEVLDYVRI